MRGKSIDQTARSLATAPSRRALLRALGAGLVASSAGIAPAARPVSAKLRKTAACKTGANLGTFQAFGVFAQTFKAKSSGTLQSIRILVNRTPVTFSGDYVVSLVLLDADGNPDTSQTLATTTVPGGSVNWGVNGEVLATFPATGAPRISARTWYAIVLEGSPSSVEVETMTRSKNPCAGRAFIHNTYAWVAMPDFDLICEVVVA